MRNSSRALPWVLSALIHAVILLVPAGFFISQSPLIGFGSSQGTEIAVALPMSGSAVTGGTGGIALSGGDRLGVPRPVSSSSKKPSSKVSYNSPRGVLDVEGPSPLSSTDSIPSPSAQDVLNDLPASTVAPSTPDAAQEAQTPRASDLDGARIAWTQAPRALIRRRDPAFPSVLSAVGQEVEGEARITVSAAGTVTRVEITRSSGYTEIDASVEAALRDYLFSRVDGRTDTIGTVTFRFRLEKQD